MAPAGRLRVWVGILDVAEAPQLAWTLDEEIVEPEAIRPLASARRAGMVASATPRAFTGVYEFSCDRAALPHRVTVEAAGLRAELRTRTLPEALPRGFERPFTVLLASCFYVGESRRALERAIAGLGEWRRPDLAILVGDQVYLDLPTLGTLGLGTTIPTDLADLARRFEQAYVRNWVKDESFGALLNVAPTICLADDHEYWNNYPHPAPAIPLSLTAQGRGIWAEAARVLYDAFQTPWPRGLEQAATLDVAPLSFFFLDTRSYRAEDRSACVHPDVLAAFESWCDRIERDGLFGVLATGQSLLDPPTSWFTGKVFDRTLADYGDYGTIVGRLRDLADAGRPVVLLTGDVHWGRIAKAHDMAGLSFLEIISSPTSLVTTIVVDPVRQALTSIRDHLTGRSTPWPRHSRPDGPPEHFAKAHLGRRFPTKKHLGVTGDQMVLLSFRRTGTAVELEAIYFTMPKGREPEQIAAEGITLQAAR
jgi:hypothetical protein